MHACVCAHVCAYVCLHVYVHACVSVCLMITEIKGQLSGVVASLRPPRGVALFPFTDEPPCRLTWFLKCRHSAPQVRVLARDFVPGYLLYNLDLKACNREVPLGNTGMCGQWASETI